MSFWDLGMLPWERRSGRGQARAGWGRQRGLGVRGFTLLEVVLAIFIVIGMLTVALYFYQQAARLRSEVLLRIDEVSTARLLMDRMTAELRQAFAGDALMGGLTGTSNQHRFLQTRDARLVCLVRRRRDERGQAELGFDADLLQPAQFG